MLINDLETKNSFKNKVLTADVFEETSKIKKFWQNAKNIEITLDFLTPNGIIGSFIQKITKKITKV